MKAIVPHKDTLFLLAEIQRKTISLLGKETLVFPQYPLFAFSEDDIPSDMLSLTLGLPERNGDRAFFPVDIECADGKLRLSIFFARTADGSSMPEIQLPEEIKNAFPKRERIFRIADVILENNTWQIFDDKWIKLAK